MDQPNDDIYGNQEPVIDERTYYQNQPVKRSIVPLGMIGAIIGSLLGVALWILIDQVGFIAGISGVVMLLASFKGYEILGRRLDRFGMIFCVMLSFVMIFVAVNITVLLTFVDELGFEVFEYAGVIEILLFSWQDPDILMYILKNLVIGYGLYLWSGYTHIKSALRDN